jgi:DNA polymerase-3 subunit alpha
LYLIFDTETTGLPRDFKAPITDTDNWPRVVQIAWQLHDDMGVMVEHKDYLVKPEGYSIPYQAEQIHGISTELAEEQGIPLSQMLSEFNEVLGRSKFVVGQNVKFDINVMGCELFRGSVESPMQDMPVLDTCTEVTAQLCQIPGGRGGKFKLPTLTELHEHLFGEPFGDAHNATADVEATTRCFLELIRRKQFKLSQLQGQPDYFGLFIERNDVPFKPVGLSHINLKEASEKIRKASGAGEIDDSISSVDAAKNLEALADVQYSHLHNHTQFSILQSTTQVANLIKLAANNEMPAVALTDSGNLMAAFHFIAAAEKHTNGLNAKIEELQEELEETKEAEVVDTNKINELDSKIARTKNQFVKPIIGCELNVCKDMLDRSHKDNGSQVLFLAKNKKGYRNLCKMSSLGYIEGFYYVPRIDKNVVKELKGDIIVTTGGLRGEIPDLILNYGKEQAEEAFQWWKKEFGDDFYVELLRHDLEEERRVNQILMEFAKRYDVKYFASNNTFYPAKEEAYAHDILLCVKDGEKKDTPIGKGRGFRHGFPNDQFYFKSQTEMKELFKDLPEAIITIEEIVDKCEQYVLASDVLLPEFGIPDEFQDSEDEKDGGKRGENAFLRHLTYEGAKLRYKEITPAIEERLDFELSVIANTGYPGYFLIVQDFIAEARRMGVSVGPGRGSAAGSAVAFCTKITNIDPIKYDLLFERFLNPDRVSMPDIDIDFDDEGRGRVIQYVIDKYGSSQVAQIITYGTMAAKSSIRDTGRVLDLPLPDTDRIAKMVPDIKLKKLFGLDEDKLKEKLNAEQMVMANELKLVSTGSGLEAEVVNQARLLEGSVRNTGIHACGVIITPSDIREYVPVAISKDANLWCTQFDNSVVEDAGLLKMDFLGLKTLTLIKDTLKIVKARDGVDIDIEEIPLDDEKTYALFQRGETVGIFQYESPGMQKHLKSLKPSVFADLIAMNALYRPGPIEYIPSFIKRKNGEEEIVYDLDACKEYLEETYGITVYQEQVMLLSQSLAGFTKGEADTLRKAMGKKKFDLLAKLKPKFLDQGHEKGHDKKVLEKIWTDWEAFASYAFNKSHSTCYAWIAYQTAYLKAHYPAAYMAAVLSNNMNDIKSVTFFMEECRRMGLNVLGPDVNESYYKFAVNKEGAVRFGLGAIKGVGEGAVNAITEERKENGLYTSIYDLVQRIDLKAANKRAFEGITLGGGLDSFEGTHRSQFFEKDESGNTFLEKLVRFGAAVQNEKDAPPDLFGNAIEVALADPKPPEAEPWTAMEKLSREKEVVGIYISGHPLDDFELEVKNFCQGTVAHLNGDIKKLFGREMLIAGIVMEAEHRMTKNGNPFGTMEVEDKTDSFKFFLFGEDYLRLKHFLVDGSFLMIRGKVQKRKWSKDENDLEFKIGSLELLADARNKMAKSFHLQIPVNELNNQLVEQVYSLITDHPGSCELKVKLVDTVDNIVVEMPSRKGGVEVSNELLDRIKELDHVEYYLNDRIAK